ncbi:MAG: 4Fe-4S dicluster domain-containing protein [Candidatus Hodarchaeales archaeon]|jgi:Pyruvate/2-oxoacid:ferredoxin oxidoreductase delta subunit
MTDSIPKRKFFREPMLKSKTLEEITHETTVITILEQYCKGCEICTTYCPEDILTMSSDLNFKSYHYPIVIESKNDACKQCRLCERLCPEMAIWLRTEEEVIEG